MTGEQMYDRMESTIVAAELLGYEIEIYTARVDFVMTAKSRYFIIFERGRYEIYNEMIERLGVYTFLDDAEKKLIDLL